MLRFPDGFLWGAATSAYQIEGAAGEDGRGESIWDRFAARPGAIADGSDGAVACDHYHRWPRDIELMKWLGLGAYRFSVAWPRIFPSGRWQVNAAGLDFYDRLTDGLLEAGIEPFVTLYHWDLPQPLEDAGGWASRHTVDAFVEYVDVVSDLLGDRVRRFITHNEPWCISVLGYAEGLHAPGRRDWPAALAAAHHLLLSHGLATAVIRGNAPDAEVGITLNLVPAEPASSSAADRDACRAFDGTFNRWFLDPLYGRGYPEDVIADYVGAGRLSSPELPFVQPGDLGDHRRRDRLSRHQLLLARRRALGPRRRSRQRAAPRPHERRAHRHRLGGLSRRPAPAARARAARLRARRRLHHRERRRLRHRARRARPHPRHRAPALLAFAPAGRLQAIEAGVPLAGYFVWSLLDNYEWQEGYRKRFGIVWVDFVTQERVLKQSATQYRAIVAANALPAAEPHPTHLHRRVLRR